MRGSPDARCLAGTSSDFEPGSDFDIALGAMFAAHGTSGVLRPICQSNVLESLELTNDAAVRPFHSSSFAASETAKRNVNKPRGEATANDLPALAAIHRIARALCEVGGIGQKTMREYDDLCTRA